MNKKILFLIITFVFSITISSSLVSVNASVKQENNIDMIILFNENNINTNVEKFITKSGGQIVKRIPKLGGLEVECNPELISEIKSLDDVKSISQNHIIKIEENKNINFNKYYDDNSTRYYDDNSNGLDEYDDNSNENQADEKNIFSGNLYNRYQWDVKRVTNNGETFNIESGNHEVVVGVIDSGIDTAHPDLKDNCLGGKNFVPKNFQEDDTETGDISDIEDRFGHGTEVSGQIAANGRIKGVAPNIGFKSYRVFDKSGKTTASICADAIISAADDNVKVINLSFGAFYLDGQCKWTDKDTGKVYDLGDDMANYSLLKRAIEYAVNKDIVVVTAAGNEGLNCSDNKRLGEQFNDLYKNKGFSYSGLMYEGPGGFDGVINVSATDKNDTIASYSNYGQGFIDITAPGGDFDGKTDLNNLCITTSIGSRYSFNFGTSLSAPKVSAAAALLICKNRNITSNEVKNTIYKNANHIESNQYYGNGMINIYNILS